MIKNVKSFTIDRSQWGNGDVIKAARKTFGVSEGAGPVVNGSDNSYLLREDGLGCCLGLYSLACGAKETSIYCKELPYDSTAKVEQLFEGWSEHDIKTAATYNDDDSIVASYRESMIKTIFKKYGITVRFKGRISEAIKTMKDYWK